MPAPDFTPLNTALEEGRITPAQKRTALQRMVEKGISAQAALSEVLKATPAASTVGAQRGGVAAAASPASVASPQALPAARVPKPTATTAGTQAEGVREASPSTTPVLRAGMSTNERRAEIARANAEKKRQDLLGRESYDARLTTVETQSGGLGAASKREEKKRKKKEEEKP